MSTATNAQPEYDYIVVGSGAGGGPLAANLARAGHRVLLLEAGDDHGDRPSYQVPAFHGMATEDRNMEWDYFVRHYTDGARQQQDSKYDRDHQGIWYPRAGTLGGCTAHNAMITVYPHNRDWDEIAALTGDPSWSSDNMRGYFQRLEHCTYVSPPADSNQDPRRHGYAGWLTTSSADPTLAVGDLQLLKVVAAAALQVLMSQVADPEALVKLLLAKADIGLDQFNSLLDLLRPGRFDPQTAVDLLVRGAPNLIERLPDPNDWDFVKNSLEGLCIVPLAVNHGQRNGTREYIRKTREEVRDRLTVQTNALATRVLFDDSATPPRAVGVEYLVGAHLYRADPAAGTRGGEKRTARATREVILAAGTFNTPQLLMLSGVGPEKELKEVFKDDPGFKVRADLPGVGQNLQDRYEVGVIVELKKDFKLLQGATFQAPEPGDDYRKALQRDQALRQWDQWRTGVYATNGAVLGIIRKSKPERPEPDLFIFGLPGYFKGYFQTYSKFFEERTDRFTWAILKAHTQNRAGTVSLRSTDPRDVPAINFRYFGDGQDDDPAAREDLESVVEAVKFVKQIADQSRAITSRVMLPSDPPVFLDGAVSDDQIREFVKREAWGHHACGTCKMGDLAEDGNAVVDGDFRVHKTQGLRVVDASVFPKIPGFFIVTPVYMISEKATDVILAAAGPAPAAAGAAVGAGTEGV